MNETIQQALEWRYAVKKFDSQKKISEKDWRTLENSLILSPSSYGLQPWKFVVVQDPQIRQQLRDVSWGQSQVTDCSHYVVLTYKQKMDEAHIQKYIEQIAKVRNAPLSSLDGFKKMMIGDVVTGPRAQVIEAWAQRQTYIAMGFLMETAALLKVDACPMEGLDPQAYDKILKLSGTGWATIAAVAVGYRHAEDSLQKAAKVRFDRQDLMQFI
jgi:nitroreductase